MKVVLFIDSLTSGGAQRQLCCLARLLQKRGCDVCILVYYPHNFFVTMLAEEPSVPVHLIKWKGQLNRLFKIRRFVCDYRPDVLVSFLEVPCFLAELSRLTILHRFRLIASERNNDIRSPKRYDWVRLIMHFLAHHVVSNSHAQARWLCRFAPWLKSSTSIITNCVDLDHFKPIGTHARLSGDSEINIVVVARYETQKNGIALIDALALYREEQGDLPNLKVNWYGNDPDPAAGMLVGMQERIKDLELSDCIQLNPSIQNVVEIYQSADALCLVSLHEGCANVVCEAMACGLPVVVTKAGDNEYLVEDGITGILIKEYHADSIAQGLLQFSRLSREQRISFSEHARKRAEKLLSPEEFFQKWNQAMNC